MAKTFKDMLEVWAKQREADRKRLLANHKCEDYPEYYEDPQGALGHGWKCRVCGRLLQVG